MPKNMIQEISQFLWVFELLTLRLVSTKIKHRVGEVLVFTQARDLRLLFTPQPRSSNSSSILSLSDDGNESSAPPESFFDKLLVERLWR